MSALARVAQDPAVRKVAEKYKEEISDAAASGQAGARIVPGFQVRFPLLLGGAGFTTVTTLSMILSVSVAAAVFVQAKTLGGLANATNATTNGVGDESTDKLGADTLLAVVIMAALFFFAFFALALSSISDEARQTFFSTENPRERVKKQYNNFGRQLWRAGGEIKSAGQSKEVRRDNRKAFYCLLYHSSFLPTAEVRAWVVANRARWDEEKPDWWTDKEKRTQVLACAGLLNEKGEEVEAAAL